VVVKDGRVLRAYRHIKFPKMAVESGHEIPNASAYWRALESNAGLTDFCQVASGHWLESEWGKRLPDLFEQVLRQQMGFALILLWPEFQEEEEDYDPDENRTSKQRLQDRRGRWAER
jgi:hypothetical protein